MSKTCKKLLASALAATMLFSTFVSSLVVSAAATGTLEIGTETITVGTESATVDFTLTFSEAVAAPHDLATIVAKNANEETLTITAAELGEVVYVVDGVEQNTPYIDGIAPDDEVEPPSVSVESTNLTAGKILFGSGVASAADVKVINFTVTFDTTTATVGTYTVTATTDGTDYDEADIVVTTVDGAIVVEEAHEHNFVGEETTPATCTTPGVMTYTCECGEDSYTEEIPVIPHNYVDGTCDVCGEADPDYVACDHANATKVFKEKTETSFVYTYTCECGESGDIAFEIGADFDGSVETKKTISPTNDIAMTFRFATANIGAYTDLIAVINKEVYAKNAASSTTEEAYLTSYDTATTGFYSFKFADVAAYEMANKVTCALYGKNSNNEMIKLGVVENFTVGEYVTTILETYANSTATSIVNLKKALVDLLVYGAKAQTLGKFNEANPATSVLTSDQLALGTSESEYCGDSTVWSELPVAAGELEGATDVNKVTVTKTLNPAEKVYLQFTLKTHAADIENYSVKFNYYDTKGVAQETSILTFAEAGFTKYKADGVTISAQGFQFDLAPVTTFDYPVTATIYCDGVAVYEEVYSIEAYIKATYSYASNANASLANVGKFVQSLYAYGRSMAVAAKVTSYIDFTAQ